MINRLIEFSRRLLVLCLAIVVGCSSVLFVTGRAEAQQMVASWYCQGFDGLTTASGEIYDCGDYTAAHKTLPFGTKLIVTYNGRSVVVRVNDRGPYVAGRDLDLSGAAADYIGLSSVGVDTVNVEYADSSTPVGPYNAKQEPTAEPTATPTATPTAEPTAEPTTTPTAQTTATPTTEPTAKPTAEPTAEAQSAPAGEYGGTDQASGEKVPSAAENQYHKEPSTPKASEKQYGNAAGKQYTEPSVKQKTLHPNPAPEPKAQPTAQAQSGAEVQAPAPDPGSLEQPAPDLIQPGTTVEKRVILLLAAPPKGFENLPDPAQAAEQGTTPTSSTSASTTPSAATSTPESQPSKEKKSDSDGALLTVLPDTGGAPLMALVSGGALILGGFVFRKAIR